MTFYSNFSSASKSVSFYKRTSSPLRRRRAPLECESDAQFEKWCEYLHRPPKKVRLRGLSPAPPGILAGHFISTESLTEDAEECCEDRYLQMKYIGHNEEIWIISQSDLNEKRNVQDEILMDVNDIKQKLLEDLKYYKSRNKKKSPAGEKEGLERRLKDRLKVLFFKHSDWLKKTINTLKKKDEKCCKQHEEFMGISFCKA